MEEDEEDVAAQFGDETRDEEDEEYLSTLEISDENIREVGGVPESQWVIARCALRKVSTPWHFLFI